MPDITKGKEFHSGETVTAADLNSFLDDAVINNDSINAAKIADGAVGNSEVSGSAAISFSKLESLATGSIIAGSAGTATEVAMSGDATIGSDGVITVSSAATVTDNAITPAKMENGTQGDVLIYGASGEPSRLGAGTSGQFLKTQGADANPVWASPVVPAYAQAMLTGTQDVYNHSSYSVDPVEGAAGDDEAFWLVEDDNSDSMDLSLTVASDSKVKLTVDLETDTNNGTVAVGVRVQRTVDSGTTWTDLPTGDAASTRVRCAFTNHHGADYRSNARATWHYIDSPASTSVRYRVIYTCHPDYRIYLNREYSLDSDGDTGGVSTAEYRSTSYFLAEEIQQ
tara:strand:+ start:2871 stop:3890 length:1020 start_codon:yes stop_codon:yes gene_type:complete